MMKRTYFLLCLMMMLCFSCKNDEPQFKVSNNSLVFSGMETQSISLFVSPAEKYTYQVTSCPEWLNIDPLVGIASSGEIKEIKITPTYDLTQQGIYENYIKIQSSYGECIVQVKGIIGDITFYTFPDTLNVDVFVTSTTFAIKNEGNTNFSFKLEASNDYISFSNPMGDISVRGQQGNRNNNPSGKDG